MSTWGSRFERGPWIPGQQDAGPAGYGCEGVLGVREMGPQGLQNQKLQVLRMGGGVGVAACTSKVDPPWQPNKFMALKRVRYGTSYEFGVL